MNVAYSSRKKSGTLLGGGFCRFGSPTVVAAVREGDAGASPMFGGASDEGLYGAGEPELARFGGNG
jgi:hypothetical protein